MSTVTKTYKLTLEQFHALVAEVDKDFDLNINGNTFKATQGDVTLEATYDGESNLIISLTGPWIEDKIGMGKIQRLIDAVCSPA
jgi:hypothetical protein